MCINETLKGRGNTHGEFSQVATVAMNLIRTMQAAPNWDILSDSMRLSLIMEAGKNARVLCGNPAFPDHWHDKAGYATLVEKDL